MADNTTNDTIFKWAGLILPAVAAGSLTFLVSKRGQIFKIKTDRDEEIERHRVLNEVELDKIRTGDMAALRSETKDIIARLRDEITFYRDEVRNLRVAHAECQKENTLLREKIEALEDKVCELERRIDL